ncbi:unnamed protein product [Caenorhabditis brenneri]
MSDTSSDDPGKPMKQPNIDFSEVMGQLPVTTEDSEEQLNENLFKAIEQLSVTTSDENSTPPKNLSDMPVDVVELVIERSDYKEQLILRKTSKSLLELVDKQKPSCKRLEVSCKLDCIFCYYNDHCVAYVSPNSDQDALWSKYGDYLLDTIVSKVNYEKVAFDDLTSIFKNPKLQLDYFSFDCEEIYSDDYFEWREDSDSFEYNEDRDWEYRYKFENMENVLKSINHQLSVKECRIDISDVSNVTSILPYLKPGVLEKITVFSERDDDEYVDEGWSEYSETMKQVALLEQWKQAKELQINCEFDDEFPTEHATHFKRFQFDQKFLDPDTLALIRDYILQHENAEFCSISAVYSDAKDFDTKMSDTSTGDTGKPMKQPNIELSTTEDSEKTSPSVSDMPIDVVALITEKLDYKQQLKLRKVSKPLRALVDRRKPGCKTIQIVFYKDHLNITFNNQCVMYRNLDYECKNNTGIVVKRDDFMKVAFDDLASTLKNPKLQLEEFVVYNESSDKYCNEIRNTLKSLNHQVSVRKVTFTKSNPSFILAVLPYMKPGVLENISLILYKNRNNQNDEMEKIVLLEQWKQAKELELQNSFDKFPMKYATSFQRFHIGEGQIDEKKFGRIKKYLSKLDNFEQCTLSCWKFQPKLVHRLLGAPVSSTSTEEVFHHFIPNSDYYFEIKKPAQSIDMSIEKKKRVINS